MKRKRRQAKASRGKKMLAVLLIAVGLCVVAAGIYGFSRVKKRALAAEQQEKDAVEQSAAVSEEETSEQSADSGEETTPGQSGASDTETKHGQSESSDAETAAGQSGELVQEETSGQSEDQEKEERKTISIVGDSISTFKGAIPEGYYDFFPENGTVGSIKETWWRQAFEELNLELCVNASSSGATCAGDSTSAENPQVGCDEFRTGGLADAAGNAPDIILVYMGTNDLLESIPMGSNDGTTQVSDGVIANFSDAYTLMLDKLRAKYPQAKIYCCTILPVGTWGTDGAMIPFCNGADGGLQASNYADKIRQIAENKGLQVIDLYSCGVTMENILEMTSDGVHPTPAGMRCIAGKVEECLKSR
jgi:lysophospholipase L1-like esterase